MLSRPLQWLAVLTLTLTLGLHWAVLQSVAWAGMTISYSRTVGLNEALVKTFDGHHPCRLCRLVKEGKKAEKHNEAQELATKIELFFAATATPLYSVQLAPLTSRGNLLPADRNDTPPLPPPRSHLS